MFHFKSPGKANSGLGFGFPSPTRIRRETLVGSAPFYKYSQEPAARPRLQVSLQKQFIFQGIRFCSMEACSVARIMSLWDLAIHPRDLCSLGLRLLPELLALSRSLLKKFRRDEHGQPPLTETVTGKLPELPQDTLMDIFSLLEIPDLVRAGSVCSSWRSAYSSLRSLGQYKRRPQTPCLLYTSESAGENVACLYSLAENRVYKLTLPDPPIRSRHLIGSSHGWLVTADEMSELQLVNPITGEQIALPSVNTIEHVKPHFDDAGAIYKYELSRHWREMVFGEPSIHSPENLRDYLYFKAFVFSDPSTGSYIVALIHNPENELSFARAGDCKWTRLSSSRAYSECIYMDGVLYALTAAGGIDAFDLTGHTVRRKMVMADVKPYIYEHMYIVQAPWGDVLQVWREADISAGDQDEDAPEWDLSKVILNTRKILVYKVDMAAKKLVEMNGLHDHVLLLGHNQSLCLSAEEHPQLKANCVYFTDDEELLARWKSHRRDIGVFNWENNSWEEIVPPQLWCSWPAPIWITPNLTMMNSGSNK